MEKCRICQSSDWHPVYTGPIRMGKFGNHSLEEHAIQECSGCHARFLSRPSIDYEEDQYREAVDGSAEAKEYYKTHDDEQVERLAVIGAGSLRGKKVADIGCGAGSFLDMAKGFADETIAIEPADSYAEVLTLKGHKRYGYTSSALAEYEGKIDIATSFAVVEHIENPVPFLKEIKRLLAPGGFLVLSTPNVDDFMLELLPEEYGSFFYRNAHTWYFNAESLKKLCSLAGLKRFTPVYKHRFDLSNALMWAKEKKPTGLGRFDMLEKLDGAFKYELERSGHSDFLYAIVKP